MIIYYCIHDHSNENGGVGTPEPRDQRRTTKLGTPLYMAPDIIQGIDIPGLNSLTTTPYSLSIIYNRYIYI